MPKELTGQMREIANVENKYGLVLFRMSLTHLMDVGHRHMSDNAIVENNIVSIINQGKKDAADGKIPIMTPEFQCEILRCAAELAKFTPWTLFEYIKKHVVVTNETISSYLLIHCCERKISTPMPYDSLAEAQEAMKFGLIESMEGFDETVFDDYDGDEYGLEPNQAYFNHRHGNHDWSIFEQTSSGKIQDIE